MPKECMLLLQGKQVRRALYQQICVQWDSEVRSEAAMTHCSHLFTLMSLSLGRSITMLHLCLVQQVPCPSITSLGWIRWQLMLSVTFTSSSPHGVISVDATNLSTWCFLSLVAGVWTTWLWEACRYGSRGGCP